ncbi:hypothetical protein AB0C02_28095 [Micromonospora sp. NPDC048999]|uniref:hypothetical protein n=1 Tax=Micromonospora sp. NPDC048999 TaxID=3155391 RepID=UPI00340461FE
MGDLVVARTSGVVMMDGRRHPIRRGATIARAEHPIVTDNPRLWEPLRVHYDVVEAEPETEAVDEQAESTLVVADPPVQVESGGVEQATAAPGELRDVQLPGPKRPPTSGPGSGVEAWRRYAAEVTGTPVEQWAGKSREDIIKALAVESVGE